MPLIHILILALVQGITEFLPVSSSGHLVLAWAVLDLNGWEAALRPAGPDRLILDVAVHVGTLLAVCLYFWRDLVGMAVGLALLAVGRWTVHGRLALLLILATIPLVVVGFLFKDAITDQLRNVRVVAWATIGFGIVLWLADRLGMTVRRAEHIGFAGALFIGLSQVLALIPGCSRSGITMSAARLIGMERPEAARFSMLMSIPAIVGAGTLLGLDLYESGNAGLQADAVLAALVSFAVALASIALLLRWLRVAGFMPFVIYRILLGAALLIWFV